MRRALACLLACGILGLPGCVAELTPPSFPWLEDPRLDEMPGKPSAIVGDSRVMLTWTPVEWGAASYRVYRDEGEGGEESLIAEIGETSWTDGTVINKVLYRYRVAAVTSTGLEGLRSDWTAAMPDLFTVSINGGQAASTALAVRLSFGATAGTAWLRLHDSSDLSAVAWQPFAVEIDWLLTGQDGLHEVYAEFRNSLDNRSEVVRSEIILDRLAVIEGFSFSKDTSGALQVDFELRAGEIGGQAWAEIESLSTVPLFDPDGDGVFVGTWLVGEPGDTIQARVSGHFLDDVGNEAEPYFAPEILTIIPGE